MRKYSKQYKRRVSAWLRDGKGINCPWCDTFYSVNRVYCPYCHQLEAEAFLAAHLRDNSCAR